MEIYLILKLLWWLLLGVLLMGLAIMMGTDMGVGTVLRWVGRTDTERRVALNIIGPHWDGNQVWFILGGGAVFAAWPLVYATAFSGLYVVMLLLLWSMIIRPLGFEYRSKLTSRAWRNAWDWTLFVSGAVPMLVFGAAFGNLFQGLPFHFEWNLTSWYVGSFLSLFNPFAIFCGLLAVALSVFMGCAMLMIRGEGDLYRRARMIGWVAGLVAVALFAIGGAWVSGMTGYHLVSAPPFGEPQTPLQQSVEVLQGAWLETFWSYPVSFLLPLLGVCAILGGTAALCVRRPALAWALGALGWVGVIGTAGLALFPFLMPSSEIPSQSLTVWNSGSSERTLAWMLGFTLIFIPLIVWYTSWAFHVMRGTVRNEQVEGDEHAY